MYIDDCPDSIFFCSAYAFLQALLVAPPLSCGSSARLHRSAPVISPSELLSNSLLLQITRELVRKLLIFAFGPYTRDLPFGFPFSKALNLQEIEEVFALLCD